MSHREQLRLQLISAAERRRRARAMDSEVRTANGAERRHDDEAFFDDLDNIRNNGLVPTSWVRRLLWKEDR